MSTFDLAHGRDLLARTPATLGAPLRDLPEPFVHADEGAGTWSPFDVVGHLIHGERTDWMVRARLILTDGGPHAFEPFDRFAQEEASRGKTLNELLDAFAALRAQIFGALGEGDAPDVERAAWRRKATDALERAIDSGTVDPEFVRASDGLEPLRGDARFEALMERL